MDFKKKKSIIYSLIEIVEKIRISRENKKYGCAIFITSKKAFDTVNHKILEHYGISGKAWNGSLHT